MKIRLGFSAATLRSQSNSPTTQKQMNVANWQNRNLMAAKRNKGILESVSRHPFVSGSVSFILDVAFQRRLSHQTSHSITSSRSLRIKASGSEAVDASAALRVAAETRLSPQGRSIGSAMPISAASGNANASGSPPAMWMSSTTYP